MRTKPRAPFAGIVFLHNYHRLQLFFGSLPAESTTKPKVRLYSVVFRFSCIAFGGVNKELRNGNAAADSILRYTKLPTE